MHGLMKGSADMQPRSPIRSILSRPSYGTMRRIVGGMGALLVLVSLIAVEVSISTARSGIAPIGNIVNRTHKSDRLPLSHAFRSEAAHQPHGVSLLGIPAAPSKLPYGCEALVSSLTFSPLARTAGRCLS